MSFDVMIPEALAVLPRSVIPTDAQVSADRCFVRRGLNAVLIMSSIVNLLVLRRLALLYYENKTH